MCNTLILGIPRSLYILRPIDITHDRRSSKGRCPSKKSKSGSYSKSVTENRIVGVAEVGVDLVVVVIDLGS